LELRIIKIESSNK